VLTKIDESEIEINKKDSENVKWILQIKKVFKIIYKMEKLKYLEPKFAPTIYPLIKLIKVRYGPTEDGDSSVFS
jgi:hypothetical protein